MSTPLKKIEITSKGGSRNAPQLQEREDDGHLAVDVFESENMISIVAPIAGVDDSSLKISITDDLLALAGNRPLPEYFVQGTKPLVSECYWGPFSRHILLPTAVNTADITARLDRDILIISIPKARKVKTKTISLSK